MRHRLIQRVIDKDIDVEPEAELVELVQTVFRRSHRDDKKLLDRYWVTAEGWRRTWRPY